MKKDIIFAGVGGQGIVSVASWLAEAVFNLGLSSKQNEVHGMAQRGGAVVCHVRISDGEIHSNIIPKGRADFILATEPMEALRQIEYISPEGMIITTDVPLKNIPNYPDVTAVIDFIKKQKALIIEGSAFMREVKNIKAINMAAVGALINKLSISALEGEFVRVISRKLAKKGDKVIELNKKAYEFGRRLLT